MKWKYLSEPGELVRERLENLFVSQHFNFVLNLQYSSGKQSRWYWQINMVLTFVGKPSYCERDKAILNLVMSITSSVSEDRFISQNAQIILNFLCLCVCVFKTLLVASNEISNITLLSVKNLNCYICLYSRYSLNKLWATSGAH